MCSAVRPFGLKTIYSLALVSLCFLHLCLATGEDKAGNKTDVFRFPIGSHNHSNSALSKRHGYVPYGHYYRYNVPMMYQPRPYIPMAAESVMVGKPMVIATTTHLSNSEYDYHMPTLGPQHGPAFSGMVSVIDEATPFANFIRRHMMSSSQVAPLFRMGKKVIVHHHAPKQRSKSHTSKSKWNHSSDHKGKSVGKEYHQKQQKPKYRHKQYEDMYEYSRKNQKYLSASSSDEYYRETGNQTPLQSQPIRENISYYGNHKISPDLSRLNPEEYNAAILEAFSPAWAESVNQLSSMLPWSPMLNQSELTGFHPSAIGWMHGGELITPAHIPTAPYLYHLIDDYSNPFYPPMSGQIQASASSVNDVEWKEPNNSSNVIYFVDLNKKKDNVKAINIQDLLGKKNDRHASISDKNDQLPVTNTKNLFPFSKKIQTKIQLKSIQNKLFQMNKPNGEYISGIKKKTIIPKSKNIWLTSVSKGEKKLNFIRKPCHSDLNDEASVCFGQYTAGDLPDQSIESDSLKPSEYEHNTQISPTSLPLIIDTEKKTPKFFKVKAVLNVHPRKQPQKQQFKQGLVIDESAYIKPYLKQLDKISTKLDTKQQKYDDNLPDWNKGTSSVASRTRNIDRNKAVPKQTLDSDQFTITEPTNFDILRSKVLTSIPASHSYPKTAHSQLDQDNEEEMFSSSSTNTVSVLDQSGEKVSTGTRPTQQTQYPLACQGGQQGYYADIDDDCRSYFRCGSSEIQRFTCPDETKFNQVSLVCEWSQNVSCQQTDDSLEDQYK